MEPNELHLDPARQHSLPPALIGLPLDPQQAAPWSTDLPWGRSPFEVAEEEESTAPPVAVEDVDELLWGGTHRFGDVELEAAIENPDPPHGAGGNPEPFEAP